MFLLNFLFGAETDGFRAVLKSSFALGVWALSLGVLLVLGQTVVTKLPERMHLSVIFHGVVGTAAFFGSWAFARGVFWLL